MLSSAARHSSDILKGKAIEAGMIGLLSGPSVLSMSRRLLNFPMSKRSANDEVRSTEASFDAVANLWLGDGVEVKYES